MKKFDMAIRVPDFLSLLLNNSSWGSIKILGKLYLYSRDPAVKGAYTHPILPPKHSKTVGVTQLFGIQYNFI